MNSSKNRRPFMVKDKTNRSVVIILSIVIIALGMILVTSLKDSKDTAKKYNEIRENVIVMKKHLEEDGINPDRLLIHGVFIPYFRGLASQFKQFDDNLRLLNQTE
jgi:hypothetical protein